MPIDPQIAEVSLAEEFVKLLAAKKGSGLSRIGDLTEGLGPRGFALLYIFLTVPFLQPIPLPFFSIPFGIIISIGGIAMIWRDSLWLPSRLRDYPISGQTFEKIVKGGVKIILWMEKFSRPRLSLFSINPFFKTLNGLLICVFGFLVALPFPVPLSNYIPAILVLSISIGILERDGILICISYISFTALCLAVFLFFPGMLAYLGSFLP